MTGGGIELLDGVGELGVECMARDVELLDVSIGLVIGGMTGDVGLDVTEGLVVGCVTGGVELMGGVDVEGVNGDGELLDVSGKLVVGGVTGGVELLDGVGEVRMGGMTRGVELLGGDGELRVEGMTGDVVLRDVVEELVVGETVDAERFDVAEEPGI